MNNFAQLLDRHFQISERGSKISTEIRAGLTTFVTMAYILPVNMQILSDSGLESGAVFMATALSTVVGTMLMGLFAGLPLAQAPGMGLNAFFAYTVVITMGFSPAFALGAVLIEGLIFLVLSLTGIRNQLLKAFPKQLRIAISAGIGLFIMFIGLQNAGIVVNHDTTLVTTSSDFTQVSVLLAVIGLGLTIILYVKKVKGALLLGIVFTWIMGIICQLSGWYAPDPVNGVYSLIPDGIINVPPSLASSFGLCFQGLKEAFSSRDNIGQFFIVMLTFLYVDIFDTLGTFAGVATKSKMIDDDGNFPGVGRAFTSDAIATTVGAVLGTSTVTTYVESVAGVEEGGRTGLTAVVTALFFIIAIPFFPVFLAIPGFATAPALILVGIMMCETLQDFDWKSVDAIIPGVFTILFMVVGYSIATGIMWGVLSYLVIKTIQGKYKEPGIIMWVLGLLFIIKMFLL